MHKENQKQEAAHQRRVGDDRTRRTKPSARRRTPKLIVILLSVFCTLVTSTWIATSARAHLSEGATRFNETLLELSPLLERLSSERAHEQAMLSLNGATIRVQVSSFSGDPEQTTKRLVEDFVVDCETPMEKASGESALFHLPPLVQEVGGEGAAHCLKARRVLSIARLKDLLSRMSADTDLTRWGVFQTLLVRPGDRASTALSIEVTKGLVPSRMFPSEGDAPGSDHPELPRPEGRRILSAGTQLGPIACAYETAKSPASAISDYAILLQRNQKAHQIGQHQDGPRALLVKHQGQTWIAAASAHDGGATLSIARLPQ